LSVPLLDGVLGSVGQRDEQIVSAAEAQQVRRGGRRGRQSSTEHRQLGVTMIGVMTIRSVTIRLTLIQLVAIRLTLIQLVMIRLTLIPVLTGVIPVDGRNQKGSGAAILEVQNELIIKFQQKSVQRIKD
jgi:hypothetical protein